MGIHTPRLVLLTALATVMVLGGGLVPDRASAQTAPTLTGGYVSVLVQLDFSAELDCARLPRGEVFTIRAGGRTHKGNGAVGCSGSRILFSFGGHVNHGETVTVSYTKPPVRFPDHWPPNTNNAPRTTGPLRGINLFDVANFSNETVTNSMPDPDDAPDPLAYAGPGSTWGSNEQAEDGVHWRTGHNFFRDAAGRLLSVDTHPKPGYITRLRNPGRDTHDAYVEAIPVYRGDWALTSTCVYRDNPSQEVPSERLSREGSITRTTDGTIIGYNTVCPSGSWGRHERYYDDGVGGLVLTYRWEFQPRPLLNGRYVIQRDICRPIHDSASQNDPPEGWRSVECSAQAQAARAQAEREARLQCSASNVDSDAKARLCLQNLGDDPEPANIGATHAGAAEPGAPYTLNGETHYVEPDGSYKVRVCHVGNSRIIGGSGPCPPDY